MNPIQKRVQGLDVLRGIAVGLVLLRHAYPTVFGGAGVVGVVMFFTLSGYLITGILVRDIEKRGRVRYGRFYRNRAIRLLPSLVVVTAAVVVVALAFDLLDDRRSVIRTAVVALTYTGNLVFDHGSPAIGHLWTLATEEQFYLVWPMLLVFAVRRRRVVAMVILAGVAIYLVCTVTVVLGAPHWGIIYILPTSWSVSMVIGAGLFFATRSRGLLVRISERVRVIVILVASVVLALIAVGPDLKLLAAGYLVAGPVIAVSAAILIDASHTWETVSSIAIKPLLGLGVISYSAYLWDYPIRLWLGEIYPETLAGFLSIIGAIVAATMSWFIIERPMQIWKGRLDRKAAVAQPAKS